MFSDIFIDGTYSERAAQTVSTNAFESGLNNNAGEKPELRILNVDKGEKREITPCCDFA